MTNPYAKLGGGALDQELFKKKVQPNEESKTLNDSPIVDKQSQQIKPHAVTIKEKRKQISSYLNSDQLKTYKKLYSLLNDNVEGVEEIEKSDIVALGIEILSKILSTQVPKYSNIKELRDIVLGEVSKYLDTQVPKG